MDWLLAHQEAIEIIAADILQAACFILRDGIGCKDISPEYFERQDKNRAVQRQVKRHQVLGYKIVIAPVA